MKVEITTPESADQKALAQLLDTIRINGRPLCWCHVPHEGKRPTVNIKGKEVPLDLIIYRDWAEADLRWLPADRRGPCGEVSTAQVWRPTFYRLRPGGDYFNVFEVYDAGTEYLAGCYRMARKWLGETADKVQIYRLSLAFYNAGMGHRPEAALHKARAHVRRVDGIFIRAERLGVVRCIENTNNAPLGFMSRFKSGARRV